jgi:hypothetical protein
VGKVSKKAKADKRANPKYDEPQSVYREGVNAEEALREMLTGVPAEKRDDVKK